MPALGAIFTGRKGAYAPFLINIIAPNKRAVMTSQSPRIYTYKITFEEVPYYYYGVKKEKYYNQKYFGSPVTNKWCWKLYTPKKQILEFFDYSDSGWLKAKEIEDKLIKPLYQTDKWCLNENCGGLISLEILRESGKRAYKNGLLLLTAEQRKKNGKSGGTKTKELGSGIHALTTEQRIENGRKSGYKTQELGVGIHALTTEQRRENGKLIGKQHFKNKTACFSITPEKRKETIKKSHETNKKNKPGIYGISKEERREISIKASKKTNSQKWECCETGYISTAAGVAAYQKARGIDTSKNNRRKIS